MPYMKFWTWESCRRDGCRYVYRFCSVWTLLETVHPQSSTDLPATLQLFASEWKYPRGKIISYLKSTITNYTRYRVVFLFKSPKSHLNLKILMFFSVYTSTVCPWLLLSTHHPLPRFYFQPLSRVCKRVVLVPLHVLQQHVSGCSPLLDIIHTLFSPPVTDETRWWKRGHTLYDQSYLPVRWEEEKQILFPLNTVSLHDLTLYICTNLQYIYVSRPDNKAIIQLCITTDHVGFRWFCNMRPSVVMSQNHFVVSLHV